MRKIRVILGIILSDLGGAILNSIPMVLLLTLTNFFAGESSQLSPLAIALILLLSLSLFLIPFQILLVVVKLLNIELDKYGVISVAIIGGLIGGSLFYFLILSNFSLSWTNILNYALIGVIQSLLVQLIYGFIPEHWKVQPTE